MRSGEGLRTQTLSVTLASLAAAGLLGVAALVIARVLGPDGRGVFAASYSLVYVLMIVGSVGAGLGGRRLLAIGVADGGVSLSDYTSAARVLVGIQLPVSVFGAVVLLPIFGAGRSGAEQIAFVACCLMSLSSLLSRDALFGIGEGGVASLILAGGCAATLVGVVAVSLADIASVAWYLWMYAIAGALETFACRVRARMLQFGAAPPVRPDRRRAVLASGGAVMVQLLAQAAATRGDRLVIGAIAGPTELGFYAVAVSVMELLSMGSFALGNVAFQGLASGALSSKMMRRARWTAVIGTAVAAALLIVAAPWLIRFAFGDRFEEAVPALRVLAIAAVPFGSFQIDSQHLIASARARKAAGLGVAVAASMIIGDLLVVPQWGIQGAAWVSVAVYTAGAFAARFVVNAESSRRSLGVAQ